jgi:hypothetical protein
VRKGGCEGKIKTSSGLRGCISRSKGSESNQQYCLQQKKKMNFHRSCRDLIVKLKQKWLYLKTRTKQLKIKEINRENPQNHFNHGIKTRLS